jgi:Tfp pilus assembly protein PilX
MPRRTRATGTFQQRELREKLQKLEQEIALSRAAAEALSREAEQRLEKAKESLSPQVSADTPPREGQAGKAPEGTTKG